MIPGLFSWANTIGFGKGVGATPNGRRAGDPISHGSNPDPGFRKDGAPTAMAVAIAAVQPGYGNTAPMQIELDPALSKDEGGVDDVADLIKTHFELGGTQINMNIMDAAKVLEAHEDPSKYPDLVVRVTGFSAYFASLSPEFRQLVVDRIIQEA
jgi:formate C-acetyltransferase